MYKHTPFLSDLDMANVASKRAAIGLSFNINDHSDILLEILTRLDDRTLGVAACVCRLWCSVTRNETFWEMLCFGKCLSVPHRQIVVALGGYKRLYMVCVRRRRRGLERGWTREEVQLWLSLFCVDCYERLGGMKAGGDSDGLMFLCQPVNV